MKTISVKPKDLSKNWYVIDVAGQPVGRVANVIAHVLRGKHKASFVPHLDCGDNVVVVNADKVKLTGQKNSQKFYYSYSNYIGGLKATRADVMLENHPDRVLKHAVKGMLPKNKLGRALMKNLKVHAGGEHNNQAQKPQAFPEYLLKRGR